MNNLVPHIAKRLRVIASLALLAVASSSCQQNNDYVIEGRLFNGGSHFEGKYIFLVPFSGANSHNVDSIPIHESRFHFDGVVSEPEAYCLRLPKMLRLYTDDPIVILEPGNIFVKLEIEKDRKKNRVRVKGTALNDSLQNWMNYKFQTDSALLAIRNSLRKASEEDKAILLERKDSIELSFERRTRASIRANVNAFGEFLERVVTSHK